MKGVEAYPLHWPDGWPRVKRREHSRFQTTFASARDALFTEIHRLGGRYPTLSTNIPLRRDGLPYAGQKEPDDRGVAVYFQYGDKSMVFACDRWNLVQDNIQAVRKTIEAIRGIERWGASDMMERAFSAFEALSDLRDDWRGVLGIDDTASLADAKSAYRKKAKETHPDNGGDPTAFTAVNQAWERAQAQLH